MPSQLVATTVTHEQYSYKRTNQPSSGLTLARYAETNADDLFIKIEKRSITHSYHSAEYITVRTPVTDLAADLAAGLWGNTILGGASRLDAFSGYPVRT